MSLHNFVLNAEGIFMKREFFQVSNSWGTAICLRWMGSTVIILKQPQWHRKTFDNSVPPTQNRQTNLDDFMPGTIDTAWKGEHSIPLWSNTLDSMSSRYNSLKPPIDQIKQSSALNKSSPQTECDSVLSFGIPSLANFCWKTRTTRRWNYELVQLCWWKSILNV